MCEMCWRDDNVLSKGSFYTCILTSNPLLRHIFALLLGHHGLLFKQWLQCKSHGFYYILFCWLKMQDGLQINNQIYIVLQIIVYDFFDCKLIHIFRKGRFQIFNLSSFYVELFLWMRSKQSNNYGQDHRVLLRVK